MATPTDVPSPDEITHAEFTALLDEYPALVDTISKSKGSKPGQKSLQQLDEYRYGTAIADFGTAATAKEMTLDDVRLLVEWKLRHGKFRPMLMGLASSNHAPAARRTIAAAVRAYRADADVAAALAGLTQLRGIGPATASLLLSVHDPTRVVFFSDEVFYWLCRDGKAGGAAIKYTNKEYATLREQAAALVARLGVSATEVEKVAYVLFKRNGAEAAAEAESGKAARKAAKAAKAAEKPVKDTKKVGKPAKKPESVKEAPAKRKSTAVKDEEPASNMRRSKRVKK